MMMMMMMLLCNGFSHVISDTDCWTLLVLFLVSENSGLISDFIGVDRIPCVVKLFIHAKGRRYFRMVSVNNMLMGMLPLAVDRLHSFNQAAVWTVLHQKTNKQKVTNSPIDLSSLLFVTSINITDTHFTAVTFFFSFSFFFWGGGSKAKLICV